VKITFLKSFERDLKKIKDKKIKTEIKEIIKKVKNASNLSEIKNLSRIKGTSNYYRIRIRDYRIGLKIEQKTVTFVRVLHRKDIYKYFP